jgi:hypothetical protein
MASTMAEQQGNIAGIVSSEMGIAKVFGIDQGTDNPNQSFKTAHSMHDIGQRLLISVGLAQPSQQAIDGRSRRTTYSSLALRQFGTSILVLTDGSSARLA